LDRNELKLVLESLLFAADTPVPLRKFHDILPEMAQKDLREILLEMQTEYQNMNRSFSLREVAHGFQLCTKAAYSEWIKKLKKARPIRLSPATMETLAIIAYKQPLTRAEIEQIRGVDTSGVLRTLLEKRVVKILGKKEAVGRPLLYGTTPTFLTMFGLKGLKDLPTLEDVSQLDEHSLPLFPAEEPAENEESPSPPAEQAEEEQG
jgi:segregation and condensation protein B